ncbi:sigma-70 family RNA polymerase sigma factor [Corynebacterium sp. sy039]|nr:sigma-70 family RNA polymerase sigma factor [Corynebacterium sp. sy039]
MPIVPIPATTGITPCFMLKPAEYLAALGDIVITTEDDLLIDDFLGGNYASYNDLVAKHFRRVWAIAKRYTNTIEDATDVLQDGLLKAFYKIHLYSGKSSFSTWLHRLIQNNAHDLYAKRKNHDNHITIDDVLSQQKITKATSADPTESFTTGIMINSALFLLPMEQRNAVTLVDLLGFDTTHAAQELGVRPGTIKSRRSRARENLKTHLALNA